MSKSSKNKLVISLKSSSIELSVVNYQKNFSEILFSTKDLLLSNKVLNSTEFAEESLKLLHKIILDNAIELNDKLKYSDDCEIIFHSPWYLPELISEIHTGSKKSLKKFFFEKIKTPKQKDYLQVENKITNVLINGYHITKLKDITSEDIKINIFRSFIAESTFDKIRKIIRTELKQLNNFEISTSAMQSYELIKNLFFDEDNCIFFNISGELTEIGIIEDDVLTSFLTIPLGTHFFQRELDVFISDKKSLDTIQFLANNKIDENLNEKNKKVLSEVVNKWTKEIFDSITKTGARHPHKIFVFTNSNSTNFFKMILNNDETTKGYKFFHVISDIFSSKIKNQEKNKSIEFLVSAYYLSIKR